MRKVPELTAVFWVTKALINGSSEWWPDYLYGRFGLVAVTGVLGAAVVAALALQLSVRRYHAPVAVGRSTLVIIWHLIADPDARYTDLGSDFYDTRINPERRRRNHIRQLEALGYTVILERAA